MITLGHNQLLKHRLNLLHKGLLLVTVPLLFEFILVGTLLSIDRMSHASTIEALHAAEVSDETNKLIQDLMRAAAISKKEIIQNALSTKYGDFFNEINDDITRLAQTVKGNPEESAVIESTGTSVDEANALFKQLKALYQLGDTVDAYNRGTNAQRGLRAYLQQCLSNDLISMANREKGILGKSPMVQDRFAVLYMIVTICGIILSIVITLICALVFDRHIVNRIKIMLDNSWRFASYMPLNRIVGGADEIAFLDRTFHQMVKHLEYSHQKERALTDNARDVICSLDKNADFIIANPASETVLGYTDDELRAQNIKVLLLPEDIDHVQTSLASSQSSGADNTFESRIVCKDRSVKDVSWKVAWNKSEGSYFCVLHDISQLKEAERLRQEVVQMVTHDLRTPLATVQSFHEMLETGMFGALSDRGVKLLKNAEFSNKRMLSLINDLLDIERIKAGGFQINRETVVLNDLLEQASHSVSEWAGKHGVTIITEPASVDLKTYADGKRITQVLVNLLSNAVKFSPDGGTVTVSATALPEQLLVKVTDQGRGIPESMRTTIFERFQQVRTSDATEKGGSGLGLAICKAIVELHGGTIKVEPNNSQGSVFSFTLPPPPKSEADDIA